MDTSGPTTFITMYLIMIPIWLYAGYWVQKNLRTRQVPYLALGAAFSFVIMMFNVPVPGGSSGHAVGSALIAVGTWPMGSSCVHIRSTHYPVSRLR